MGVPIIAGWLWGDITAGLMAGIGGFTGLYGSGRPYFNRARHLAIIAAAFALAVGLGLWVGPVAWAVVLTVASIAMLATWLGNALQVGPPGAYMFALACAAGTAMPAAHLTPVHAATLVFAGGAFAWLLHMAGALVAPRGPERTAVTDAGRDVIRYIEARGSPREDRARHQAAATLHRAWSVLVSQQPARVGADGTLGRLRALNRELHLRFAGAMGAADRSRPTSDASIEDDIAGIRQLMSRIDDPRGQPGAAADAVPLGHPGVLAALAEALRPGSNSRRVILRVGIAALLAGALGATFHLERAYWAVAAAVLMLHQGFDWQRMLQRSVERLVGTWVGLLLAAAIIVVHPQGIWLALVVMALQFTIEMLVMRNYALAVVFITGAALTLASGGHPVESPAGYLLARGVDTLAGCVVALLVFRLLPPRPSPARIPLQLLHALDAVGAVVGHLASAAVTTADARHARRHLQHATFALAEAHEESLSASPRQRRAAEATWPAIAATERLAYRTLSACWALERRDGDAAREYAATMFHDGGARRVREALDMLAAAIRDARTPPPLPAIPRVFEAELHNLRQCLVREPRSEIRQPAPR